MNKKNTKKKLRLSSIVKKLFSKIKRIILKINKKLNNLLFTKHIELDLKELFFQHNSEKGFLRYDIIVRLLAIENLYNKNSNGFDMYKKMQSARESSDWVKESVIRFKSLIESYQTGGYDAKSEIELDKNLSLLDGSHRMALAIFFNEKKLSCKIRPYALRVDYGIEWFIVNGFSQEEIEIIKSKYMELKSKLIVPFTCTIWPPAEPYFEKITENLRLYGSVIEVKDLELTKYNFRGLARGMYYVDDIEDWKIEKKLQLMGSSEIMKLRMVTLLLEEPEFRLKQTNNNSLSRRCELIKKTIRQAYKGEIENYFHDNIIHIGDNFYMNEYTYQLVATQLNIKPILNGISQFDYVISKFDVPFMPKNFPETFPFGKDIDILCRQDDFEKIVNTIKNLIHINLPQEYLLKEVNTFQFRKMFRIELEGCLIFQFDISCVLKNLNDVFINDMLNNKKHINNLPIPSLDFEYIIRKNELKENPKKKHHRNFVEEHFDSVNQDIVNKYNV